MATGRSRARSVEDNGPTTRPTTWTAPTVTEHPTHQEDDMHHRPRRRSSWHDVTRRGWAVLTLGCCLVAFAIGLHITSGSDPCAWASTAACAR